MPEPKAGSRRTSIFRKQPHDDPTAVGAMLREEVDGREIDGFRYSVVNHRGRDAITYNTPFRGDSPLSTKLDIGPPSWLEANHPAWIPLPIHKAYERSLPTSFR